MGDNLFYSKRTPPDCVPVRPGHPGGFRTGNNR